MTTSIITLRKELDKIRENGIRKHKSSDQILKEQIVFLNEYRKRNTLSIQELESLIKENKDLTQKMLTRIEKIKSLTGT